MRAMRAYRPQPYHGRVLFFRAAERRAGRDPLDPERPWRALAADIIVEQVPGNHLTMHVPPHVDILAQRLSVHLADALHVRAAP